MIDVAVILIVEDDCFIRELSEMTIQEWGYQTLSASDAEEALLFLRSPRQIDALFTDINLNAAAVGGCELAQQAVMIRPQLRVLYTTGNTITQKMRSLFVAGTHCLVKPYTPDQLHNTLEGLLVA